MLIKSALRIYLSVSYGMIGILLTGSLRSPPPIRLRRTSPCSGGRINRSMLSCRDMAPWLSTHSAPSKRGKGGGTSHQRGIAFSRPSGRLYGFIQTGAFYDLEAPYNNPRAKGASNLSPLRTFGPSGRQPSRPTGLVHKPPAHYFINSPICLLISPAIICLAFQSPWMPSMASSPGMTG